MLLLTDRRRHAASRREGEMTMNRTQGRIRGRIGAGAILLAASCGLLAGCSATAYPPTYTQAELKAICERRGGWWRGDLIPGFCEYQGASLTGHDLRAASLVQAP